MLRLGSLLLSLAAVAQAATEVTMYSGSTPLGSTLWMAESQNSIYVDVNFDHLGLTAPPAVLTRLIHRLGCDSGARTC